MHCDAPGEINLDGELLMARDARFEVVPHAVRFLYPQGLRFRSTVAQPSPPRAEGRALRGRSAR